MRSLVLSCLAVLVASTNAQEPAAPPEVHTWKKVAPPLEGRRWDVPLGATDKNELFILGGRTDFGSYKKPRPYDVLKWTGAAWENQLPAGKAWGPLVGNVSAPGWKNENWGFTDAEGNTRPNWCIYGTFSLGQKYGWDPDTKKFYFYALRKTFSYDPAAREWKDLQPATDPESELGGILLWSSLVYDAHKKRFILFGGGNIESDRGDAGTWAYSPAENTWKQLQTRMQPPPRANSRLAYVPLTQEVVLFGGDRLDALLADTWKFHSEENAWEPWPIAGPSPRAGHALLWLPKCQRTLLLGGYEYTSSVEYVAGQYRTLPLEAWLFDSREKTWSLVKRWEKSEAPQLPKDVFTSAAVQTRDNVDIVTVLGTDGVWQCAFNGRIDEDATAKLRVAPESTAKRTKSYDPAWYEDVPPADVAASEAELRDLPTNRWVKRATPKLPGMNMDWGSAVFDTANDKILRFSGGHSAYSGTAPFVYDVKTDRYSLPFAPELPIEYVYSNDQVHGEWSFGGNPWMSGHTYKSTGFDPQLKQMIFAPHDYTYFFAANERKWTRGLEKNPYRRDFYNVTLCATPDGCVAWGDPRTGKDRLWKMDAESRTWKPLTVNGTLPDKSPDQHGLAFDSKRQRLLFFSNVGKHRGDVTAVNLATGEATLLNAAGKDLARVPSRETVYIPAADVVLLGARATVNGEQRWLLYDCAANAWKTLALAGDDPIGKGTEGKAFHNSVGLMVDPTRKLVFAVGQYSHVHVLRPDFAAAE